MSRNITDLREKLFDTIDALNDKEKPLDVERAQAIVKVAGQIIESAKVEVKAMELGALKGTGFVGIAGDGQPRPQLGHERLSAVGRK